MVTITFFARKPTNPEFGASYKGGWLSYTFHFTGETRPITYHITCNSKNLSYTIRCKRSHKVNNIQEKDD